MFLKTKKSVSLTVLGKAAIFASMVAASGLIVSASGATAAMPAFGKDPNIIKYVDDIYKYLTARARGGLAPGRPKK